MTVYYFTNKISAMSFLCEREALCFHYIDSQPRNGRLQRGGVLTNRFRNNGIIYRILVKQFILSVYITKEEGNNENGDTCSGGNATVRISAEKYRC